MTKIYYSPDPNQMLTHPGKAQYINKDILCHWPFKDQFTISVQHANREQLFYIRSLQQNILLSFILLCILKFMRILMILKLKNIFSSNCQVKLTECSRQEYSFFQQEANYHLMNKPLQTHQNHIGQQHIELRTKEEKENQSTWSRFSEGECALLLLCASCGICSSS